jgi:hypothetical protein
MTTSNVLQKLIRPCVDDGHTLRHVCMFVDAARPDALIRLALERGQFVMDLERLAKREQSHDGSWSELSREAARGVWVATAGRNNGDVITSCRHSRGCTDALYEEAVRVSWHEEIHHVLTDSAGVSVTRRTSEAGFNSEAALATYPRRETLRKDCSPRVIPHREHLAVEPILYP